MFATMAFAQPSLELTLTPVEHSFTASQACIQWLSSQEPRKKTVKDPVHKETTIPTNLEEEQPSPLPRTTHKPLQPSSNLNLQSLLLALAKQVNLSSKKRYHRIKKPDLFSGGSPDKLWAFIFQCQIYFCACEGEFNEGTKKIFFVISYLQGIVLDYFEPFTNEPGPYQNLDFLEDWSSFIQKLSNIFGFYTLEDNDEDAIVAIPFPNKGKAINYFICFAKY